MADLADRLAALGFRLVLPSDTATVRAQWLSHAVREFQIYASMPQVARQKSGPLADRWLDRIEPAANAQIYTGPKDGDPTGPALEAAVAAWEAAGYRCPVVVEVYTVEKGKLTQLPAGADGVVGNYWRYDDARIVAFHGWNRNKAKRLLVRVCDLTGLYRPAHDQSPSGMERSGGISLYTHDWFGGFLKKGEDADEILPETLIGTGWQAITRDATKSTFRVLRAISEFEAGGRFDGLNSYDDATFSFGPYNWALAPFLGKPAPSAVTRAGELPAYLAFWAGKAATDAAAKLLTPFGITLKPTWPSGQAGANKPSWSTTRNYVGRLDWAPLDADPTDPGKKALGDLAWVRTTHWFWRFLALSRYIDSFRRRQWDLSRTRLRDILAFEIDPSDRPGKPEGTNKVRLDKMFTSEAAVALLVRCHVRKSGYLASRTFRHPTVRLALALANLPADVTKWKAPEQYQLVEALVAAAAFMGLKSAEKKKLSGKLDQLAKARPDLASRPIPKGGGLYADCRAIASWPRASDYRWSYPKKAPPGKYALTQAACDPLSQAPGSFKLDDLDLPPMP